MKEIRKNPGRLFVLISSGLYAVLVAAAAIVPRFAARGMEGLGAAGAAGGSFLILGSLAVLTSVVTLVIVVWNWKRLPPQLRAVGLTPPVLSAVAIAVLVVYLKREMENAPQSPPLPPKTLELPTEEE